MLTQVALKPLSRSRNVHRHIYTHVHTHIHLHTNTFKYIYTLTCTCTYQNTHIFENGHMRIHTRTLRNTTLHHPSMHCDTDTDQNTTTSRQFRTHLDQSRNCLYLLSRTSGCAPLNLCWSTREWVVAALGRRWTRRLWRATCRRAGRRVPSPRTVGGQAAVFVNVLRQSSEETRRWC